MSNMKRLRFLGLIFFLLHIAGLSGLRICFLEDLHEAHTHASDHIHHNRSLPDQPDLLHCSGTLDVIAVNGAHAKRSSDYVSGISDTSDIFVSNVVFNGSLLQSPPTHPPGLPPYLTLSVLRI